MRDRIETEAKILPHNHTSQGTAILELKLLLSYERDRDRERQRQREKERKRMRDRETKKTVSLLSILPYKVRETSLVKHCI